MHMMVVSTEKTLRGNGSFYHGYNQITLQRACLLPRISMERKMSLSLDGWWRISTGLVIIFHNSKLGLALCMRGS